MGIFCAAAILTDVGEGVSLIEIAPGVDLESDILDRMGFAPHTGRVPRVMDEMLFTDVEGET